MEDRITQDSVAQNPQPNQPIQQPQAPVNPPQVENPQVVPPVQQTTPAQVPNPAPVQPQAPVEPPVTQEVAQTATQAPAQVLPVENAAPVQPQGQASQAPVNPTPSEQQFATPPPAPTVIGDEAYRELSDKKRHRIKAKLDAQEKIMTMIPIKDGEPADSWEYVAINGYPIWIKKGVFVSVPKQVAKLLADSYGLTYSIGQEHLIGARQDRLDALK